MATRKIVAIGGGDIFVPCRLATTIKIDRVSIALARENLPDSRHVVNMLFIPTASGDDIMHCHGMFVHFELALGCKVDYLKLSEKPKPKEIKDKVAWADLIYVGGGNTAHMMKEWRRVGLDKLLIEAANQGKVMTGRSAGSICWFNSGLSDSEKYSGRKNWKPTWVDGLRLIKAFHSPHYDIESSWRIPGMDTRAKKDKKPGLALDDNCALIVVGDQFRILSSKPSRAAHAVTPTGTWKIPETVGFRPLSELFDPNI